MGEPDPFPLFAKSNDIDGNYFLALMSLKREEMEVDPGPEGIPLLQCGIISSLREILNAESFQEFEDACRTEGYWPDDIIGEETS